MSRQKMTRGQMLRAVVEGTDRRDVQSQLELDPETMDKNKIYRFVKDEPVNISRKLMKGYRPVLLEEGGVRPVVDIDDQADGLIRVADTILMACDRDKVEGRRLKTEKYSEARLKLPKQRVKEMAKQQRVKTTETAED